MWQPKRDTIAIDHGGHRGACDSPVEPVADAIRRAIAFPHGGVPYRLADRREPACVALALAPYGWSLGDPYELDTGQQAVSGTSSLWESGNAVLTVVGDEERTSYVEAAFRMTDGSGASAEGADALADFLEALGPAASAWARTALVGIAPPYDTSPGFGADPGGELVIEPSASDDGGLIVVVRAGELEQLAAATPPPKPTARPKPPSAIKGLTLDRIYSIGDDLDSVVSRSTTP